MCAYQKSHETYTSTDLCSECQDEHFLHEIDYNHDNRGLCPTCLNQYLDDVGEELESAVWALRNSAVRQKFIALIYEHKLCKTDLT